MHAHPRGGLHILQEPDKRGVLRLRLRAVGELAQPAEGQEEPRHARPQWPTHCHWRGAG